MTSSDNGNDPPRSEDFLSRWSRLKREAAAAPPATNVEEKPGEHPVELPAIETLTPDSDFSPFMQAHVEPDLKRAALKKLFADPHFNVMDGLDVYIDDYSKPDPLPAAVVAGLTQFKNLFGVQPEEPKPPEPHDATQQPAPLTSANDSSDQSPAGATVGAAEAVPELRERDNMSIMRDTDG